MSSKSKIAIVTGAGSGCWTIRSVGPFRRRLQRCPCRPAQRSSGGNRRCSAIWRKGAYRSHRCRQQGVRRKPVCRNQEGVRPARRGLQQRGLQPSLDAARRCHARAVAGGRRRQSDGGLLLHPGSLQGDEGPGSAGRPHHQQRLGLGLRAKAQGPPPTPPPSTRSAASPRPHRSTAANTTSPSARSTSATP